MSFHGRLDAEPTWVRQMTSFGVDGFAYRNKVHRLQSIFSSQAYLTGLYVDTISWIVYAMASVHPNSPFGFAVGI